MLMQTATELNEGYFDSGDAPIPPPALSHLIAVDPTRSHATPNCGERALLRAVLYDAILCLQGQGVCMRDRARATAEARRWMESRKRNYIFTFESICHILDIDPNYLRERLLRDEQATPEHGAVPADTTQPVRRRIRSPRLQGNTQLRGTYRASVDGRRGSRS